MTIDTFFNQATNPNQILAKIKELLNRVNPQFFEEEKKYNKAVLKLKKAIINTIPSAEEYLAALEESYGYELLYICWQGFQYNLDCFNSPVNALLLQGDFETQASHPASYSSGSCNSQCFPQVFERSWHFRVDR